MDQPRDSQLDVTLRLVQDARQGQRQAIEDLFARYLPRVERIVGYRLGRQAIRNWEDEDILQESLLKAFQSLDQFEPRSEGTFYNWLARCVETRIVDYYRNANAQKRGGGKVRRFGDFAGEDLSSSIFRGREPTPSQVYRAKEMDEKIDEALHKLNEPDRELIILRQLCEMSYSEIAETMSFPTEAAARKAFSRALEKLREMIGA